MTAKSHESVIKIFLNETIDDHNHVIDVGCGDGWVSAYLAEEKEGCRVDGIDIDSEKIAKAHGGTTIAGGVVSYRQCRAEDLTKQFESSSYDVAVSIHSFHHYEDPLEALKQIGLVLRPGGQQVLCELSPTYGQTLDECKRYSMDEIASFVTDAGLIIEISEEKDPGVFLVLAKKS